MDSFGTKLDSALYGDELWPQFVSEASRLGLNSKALSQISGPDDPDAAAILPLEYWNRVLDVWRKWCSAR